jgi:hypothetical protein
MKSAIPHVIIMGVEICRERLVWVLIILIALPPRSFTLGGMNLIDEGDQSAVLRTTGLAAEDIFQKT